MGKSFLFLFIGLGLCFPFMLYSQDDAAFDPNSFLNSTFLDETESSEENFDTPIEEGDGEETTISSSTYFNLNLVNLPRYNLILKDNIYDTKGDLYFPVSENLIQIHSQIRYTFWQRRLSFSWDASLYNLTERKDRIRNSFNSEILYHLNELSLTINVLNNLILGLGKIKISEGTAFLINPTDFLDTRPRFNDFSPFYRNQSIGAYQIQLQLLLKNWEWYVAYIPFTDTAYKEFKRPYPDKDPYLGEVSSRLSWQGENLKTKFIFFWNGYPQGGVNLSATLGDEVVIFFEGAAKALSRPRIIDNGDPYSFPNVSNAYNRYKVEEKYEYRVPMLVGVTYTPANLFTLATELYFNEGEELNYWNLYRDDLDNLENIAKELEGLGIPSIAPLSAEYRGIAKEALNYHDPLTMQTLFIGVSLSRNDAFSDYTTQIFNFNTRFVYSILDTGFFWANLVEWEAPEVFSLGLFTSWYFGKEKGVFTSVPRNFTVGLATQLRF